MNRLVVVLAVFLSATTASAGPVLLASFDTITNGGVAPQADPRLEFIMDLPANFFADPSGLGAGRGIFVEDREMRSVYFDTNSDPAFDSFAAHATNGVEEQFVLWSLFPTGGGDGNIGTESELFGISPDLVGYEINYIKLIIFDVRFDPWVPDPETFPEIEGYKFLTILRYEFYGTPIPEPRTASFFLLGMIGILARTKFGRKGNRKPSFANFELPATGLIALIFGMSAHSAAAQCNAGGPPNTQVGLSGNDINPHVFANQCFAAPSTNVTITIEAMADLGCNNVDATSNVANNCGECFSIPCCGTAPENKYVTLTANNQALTPSVPGNVNIPTNGQFFRNWELDCTAPTQLCLESGRSPCDPFDPGPNRHTFTIPAATWNLWLGASGNTMTIRVITSAAVTSAPFEERSLALYCESIGFGTCTDLTCDGRCGPDTFSRVSISYAAAPCSSPSECPQGNDCQYGDCVNGSCTLLNESNGTTCSDGLFCTVTDACSNGACAGTGNPCGIGFVCDESLNACVAGCVNGQNCTDNLFCSSGGVCLAGKCVGYGSTCPSPPGTNDPLCNELLNTCDTNNLECTGEKRSTGFLAGFGHLCPKNFTFAGVPHVTSPVMVRTYAQGQYDTYGGGYRVELQGVGTLVLDLNRNHTANCLSGPSINWYFEISPEDWNDAVDFDGGDGVGNVRFDFFSDNTGCSDCGGGANVRVVLDVTFLDEAMDCNQNGLRDDCDITAATSEDCNVNGVPDECDIAASTSLDCDANGIPDECSCSNCVCPLGLISTTVPASPPHLTRDARQPHPVGNNTVSARQGLGSANEPITITMMSAICGNVSPQCFQLCETGIETVKPGTGTPPLSANQVASVTKRSSPANTYDIVFNRPISAGHWTTIKYWSGSKKIAYASLPGDVNGDGAVQIGTPQTPGPDRAICPSTSPVCSSTYRRDIDHSGVFDSADISTLDQLHDGAGTFIQWEGKLLPSNTCAQGGGGGPYCPSLPCGGGGGTQSQSMMISGSGSVEFGGELSEGEEEPELDENAWVANGFAELLTGSDPVGDEELALFQSFVSTMTQWCLEHFSAEEKMPFALWLSDPERAFASQAGQNAAEGVVQALAP